MCITNGLREAILSYYIWRWYWFLNDVCLHFEAPIAHMLKWILYNKMSSKDKQQVYQKTLNLIIDNDYLWTTAVYFDFWKLKSNMCGIGALKLKISLFYLCTTNSGTLICFTEVKLFYLIELYMYLQIISHKHQKTPSSK